MVLSLVCASVGQDIFACLFCMQMAPYCVCVYYSMSDFFFFVRFQELIFCLDDLWFIFHNRLLIMGMGPSHISLKILIMWFFFLLKSLVAIVPSDLSAALFVVPLSFNSMHLVIYLRGPAGLTDSSGTRFCSDWTGVARPQSPGLPPCP